VAGAKDILAEVLQEGDAAQRAAAQEILTQLS
jgi:FimV-like protein